MLSSQSNQLSILADVSGVSNTHFALSFKRGFSASPHRYLLTRRIGRAKVLLHHFEAAIIQIALQTDWNSPGTFGRIFRDFTGESPSDLRRREQASAHQLDQVPRRFVSAAYQLNLKTAVSEKRRRDDDDRTDAEKTEVPK